MRASNRNSLNRVVVLLLAAVATAGCAASPVGPGPGPGSTPSGVNDSSATPKTPAAATVVLPAASTTQTGTPPVASSPQAGATPAASPAQTGATPAATPDPDLLYADDFKNPKSGWPDKLVFGNYYVGYHEPDYYHVEVHARDDETLAAVPGRTFDDFTAEVKVLADAANTASQGDFRYGLAIRRTGNQFYAFTISPRTHAWAVLKNSPAGEQVLSKGTDDSINGLQAEDTLRVDAVGPVFVFTVNGRVVGQASDKEYTSGEVAFFVQTLDAPKAHIHYDSIAIRKAAGPLPPQLALYQDDFKNPKSGWPDKLVFGNYYVGYHEPDYYHVEVHAPEDEALMAVPKRTFDDFTAEVKVLADAANTASQGDFRYGLAIRRTGNQFYAFTISPRTHAWAVLKNSPSAQQVLSKGTDDSINGLQAEDTLRVDAAGSTLVFYINGKQVGQVSDKEYASGEVAFFVQTLDAPKAHIHYDSIVIQKPPS